MYLRSRDSHWSRVDQRIGSAIQQGRDQLTVQAGENKKVDQDDLTIGTPRKTVGYKDAKRLSTTS